MTALSDMTVEQLKAIAWDMSETIRTIERRIEAVRNELERRRNDDVGSTDTSD